MTTTRHFDSYTETRTRLRDVLDAARSGLVTTVVRDHERYVVSSARDRRDDLARLIPAHAEITAEGGGWSVALPGIPVHGDAETCDEALEDMVYGLREYAEDWNDRLRLAPNHRCLRGLVELVELSSDEQLRAWLVGEVNSDAVAAAGPVRAS